MNDKCSFQIKEVTLWSIYLLTGLLSDFDLAFLEISFDPDLLLDLGLLLDLDLDVDLDLLFLGYGE